MFRFLFETYYYQLENKEYTEDIYATYLSEMSNEYVSNTSNARENIDIELPKKEVEIIDIKLLDIYEKDRKQYFKFYTKVSKRTFIRSLIKDISNDLAIQMTMSGLVRVSQGPFKLDDCNNLNDNFRLLQAHEIFDYKVVELGQELYKKVINGNKAILPITDDKIIFSSGGNDVAIYELNNNMYQPLIMLK